MKGNFRPVGYLISILLALVLFSNQANAFGECYNLGVYNKSVIDKKKATFQDGDLKDLNVRFDYDNNVFRIKFSYNRIPNSKQTTGINIGRYDGTDCTSTDEYYKTRGFTKKITRDYENIVSRISDPDWVGNLKLVSASKNSLTLDWFGPKAYKESRIYEYCVRVAVTQPETFYQNGINCITTGPFTNCTGPGYVTGTATKDELTVWAKTKYDDLDIIECSGLKSDFPSPTPTPSPSPIPTIKSTPAPINSSTGIVANVINNLAGVRNSYGVIFNFTSPINIDNTNLINYELGIQYIKSPDLDYKNDTNYSQISLSQFSRETTFNVSFVEIRDWLKALGLETNTRAIMFKVRTNTSGGVSSLWSNGVYLLPNEYNP